jgi:hypothetical protein
MSQSRIYKLPRDFLHTQLFGEYQVQGLGVPWVTRGPSMRNCSGVRYERNLENFSTVFLILGGRNLTYDIVLFTLR